MRAAALRPLLLVLLALGISTLTALAEPTQPSPPIKVQLRAPWTKPSLSNNASSLLLEILEAANARAPDSFFPLVTQLTAPWNAADSSSSAAAATAHPDAKATSHRHRHHKGKHHLQHPGPTLASLSDRQLVSQAEDAIRSSHLFGTDKDEDQRASVDAALQLWHTSLALHDQSPRVQAFMQLYRTLNLDHRWSQKARTYKHGVERCHSWVDFEGQVLCDEDEVVQAIRQAAGQQHRQQQPPVRLLPFDHVLPARSPVSQSSSRSAHGHGPDLTFILYGDPFSFNFWGLHSLLEAYATGHREAEGGHRISYVLRWRPSADDKRADGAAQATPPKLHDDSTLYLAGYGAYLDLKKVDYLVIDDRKLREDAEVGQLDDGASDGEDHGHREQSAENRAWIEQQIGQALPAKINTGDDAVAELAKEARAALTKEEIDELGIRAAHVVASSSDPLRALEELSQNFPLYAERLARSSKLADWDNADMVNSLLALGDHRVKSGASELWLNGKSLDSQDFSPLRLIKTLDDERRLIAPLLGRLAGGVLDTEMAVDLISSLLIGRAFVASSDQSLGQAFFDASDRLERQQLLSEVDKNSGAADPASPGAITWWNDVTKGATSRWSKDLFNLLRPMWPGQFPQISLNLFNVVMVLDLGRRESCRFLSESIGPSIGKVGLHWGLVPGGLEGQDASSDSAKLARLFWEVFDLGGSEAATSYLRKLASSKKGGESRVDVKSARNEASLILHAHLAPGEVAQRLDDVVQGRVARHQQREKMARAYIARLRASTAESPRGHVFVNGQHVPFGSQLIQMLHQKIQDQIQILAPAIYQRHLTAESENLETVFYDQPETLKFRSKLVFPPVVATLDGGEDAPQHEGVTFAPGDIVSALHSLKDGRGDAEVLNRFLYSDSASQGEAETHDEAQYVNSTVWVMGDLDSSEGAEVVLKVISASQQAGKASERFRIGFLHVPVVGDVDTKRFGSSSPPLSAYLHRLMQDSSIERLAPAQLAEAVAAYVPLSDNLDQDDKIDGPSAPANQHEPTLEHDAAAGSAAERAWATPAMAAADKFWQRAGASVAATLRLDASRGPALLVHGKVVQGFKASDIGPEDIAALLTVESAKKVDAVVRALTTLKPDFDRLPARERSDLVAAVVSIATRAYAVDPADEGIFVKGKTPRTAILEALGSDEHVFELGDRASAALRLSVLIDPLSEAAQKWSTILRTAVKLQGAYVRVILNPKLAYGGEMPLKRFYRFSAPTKLRFDERGRELVLETPDGSRSVDTIVMANLAYLQFKAQPGLWRLAIRPGRSSQLYEMVSVGNVGWDSPGVEVTGEDITLDTLSGLKIYPVVRKRKGQEAEDLLEELDAEGRPVKKAARTGANGIGGGGVVGMLRYALDGASRAASQAVDVVRTTLGLDSSSSASQTSTTAVARKRHADINIFTVASGHLYERMAYIMVLSVVKHTQSSVKFWFIENFLSPSFKEFIPHLAERYGFEYELVTYAWPHWLRAQREKQRTIWGYKILFLDTLFPLDLSKVIFVDADQVVRTDLQELVDLDLGGAVYGYPPMGDDSDDMDGFRFWKHGYWKEYLRGRPYHISALYVVDLHRFRRVAAGDKLRGQYQALSADPASLANLDQDLPNNMQGSLPIHTLDKEWLWCETWCSSAWLDDAKTIDLCSNPKTKEPKLDRARRQIPEWSVYDAEVAALASEVAKRGESRNVVDPEQVVVDGGPRQGSHEADGGETRGGHDEL
ncbi:uncharacterized protein PFL1_01092 [Pseudozyma flocculosa PF-1]|uniref:uncharacterized protein n=1 Tax=Pseudozyma flocculosa PF-1 TaxID=1277687 RepID=UPI0004560D19|nr:uncharacterized protein PFL1_01092 [Pseudozyma flocculosa PF-1]EPQ31760.1 hypothetical protein PFL1_01092 [Pseudozyma flocculosa PF-1]